MRQRSGNAAASILAMTILVLATGTQADPPDEQKAAPTTEDAMDPASDPTGVWVSADSETRRTLTLDGDQLEGRWGRDSEDGRYPTGGYRLTRVDAEHYRGTASAKWRCWYYSQGYRRENDCAAEYPIELRLTGTGRIEGRLFMPSLDAQLTDDERARDCDACGENRESVWQSFLWVREED